MSRYQSSGTFNTVVATIIIYLSIPFSSSFQMSVRPSTNNPNFTPLTSLRGSTNNNDPIGSYLDSNPEAQPITYAQNNESTGEEDDDEDTALKAARFSIFAPDANSVDTSDFRSQLKDNMKADLERRRLLPDRGNQPTRNYLSGL